MINRALPTKYAPAERAAKDEVQQQHQTVNRNFFSDDIINKIPLIIMILNEQRQIVFVNNALISTLNLEVEDDYLGMRPGELVGCIHAFESSGGCGTTEFCRKCGAVNAILGSWNENTDDTKECRIELKGNRNLDLRINASPFYMEGQHYTVFTILDIADEKRRTMLERIFFHDLMNTAGGIKGFTDLIKESSSDEPELVNILAMLSDRLIEEIQAQRDLLAAERGTLTLNSQPIFAARMLTELVELYKRHPISENKSIRLINTSSDGFFISDERLVRRIVGNMLKNAVEAVEPGQEVTMELKHRSSFIAILVHNPGYIQRDIQLQIFHRSYSTKSLDRGLGTYSMKLLSEKYLKARVGFTSTRENGTTFYAIFPNYKETK